MSWRTAAVVAVVLFSSGLIAGVTVGRRATPARASARVVATEPPRTDDAGPGPRRVVAGIPIGFARTRDGALAAARAYGDSGELLLTVGDDELKATVDAMSARESGAALLADARGHRDALVRELGSGPGAVRWREAPLAARMDGFGADRATVSLWRVGVLWSPGAAPPQAQWSTSRYELVWEHGDWKLVAQSSVPGPAPVNASNAAPVSADEIVAALGGFTVPVGW